MYHIIWTGNILQYISYAIIENLAMYHIIWTGNILQYIGYEYIAIYFQFKLCDTYFAIIAWICNIFS